uniref:Anaphase-promoting complex subunit 11 RING-H2 finger domain-containing protein n=1 Tax=Oryza barthii TaxID=65489 RepID=A0A0D3FHH5_9ORYZ
MKVKILQWHSVASWTWDAQDETCGICRMAFDGCCPDCKFPGDDCPLIWGSCNHAFHLHCILKWADLARGGGWRHDGGHRCPPLCHGRGFCRADFLRPEAAASVAAVLHGRTFDGRHCAALLSCPPTLLPVGGDDPHVHAPRADGGYSCCSASF